MKIGIFFVSILLAGHAFSADLLVDKLKEKGFTCASIETGDICKVESVSTAEFNYSKPIGIYVPKNVRRPTDILLHLHGHLGICEKPPTQNPTVEQMMNTYQFPQQMKAAGAANSVMILPLSENKCKTFEAELAPHFVEFMKWVNTTVDPAQKEWIISGHSGAGRALGTIMQYGSQPGAEWFKKIHAAVLLDATYNSDDGYMQKWSDAVKANPKLQIYNAFIPSHVMDMEHPARLSGTDLGSKMLKEKIPSLVQIPSQVSHCEVPKTYYANFLKKALAPELTPNQPSTGPR